MGKESGDTSIDGRVRVPLPRTILIVNDFSAHNKSESEIRFVNVFLLLYYFGITL